MPLYEYQCQSCQFRFEKLQRLSDSPPRKCPECGGNKVAQLMSAPAVQFRGSGWYVTDYQRKGSGGDSKAEKKAESKPETKSETKTETKSEAKPGGDAKGAKEKK